MEVEMAVSPFQIDSRIPTANDIRHGLSDFLRKLWERLILKLIA